MNSANLGPDIKIEIYLSAAILKNGRHIVFSIGQYGTTDLITLEMSHANVGV